MICVIGFILSGLEDVLHLIVILVLINYGAVLLCKCFEELRYPCRVLASFVSHKQIILLPLIQHLSVFFDQSVFLISHLVILLTTEDLLRGDVYSLLFKYQPAHPPGSVLIHLTLHTKVDNGQLDVRSLVLQIPEDGLDDECILRDC